MTTDALRLLVLPGEGAPELPAASGLAWPGGIETTRSQDLGEIRGEPGVGAFDAVLADPERLAGLLAGETSGPLAAVLEALGQGVGVIDAQGRLAWGNRVFYRFPEALREQVARLSGEVRTLSEKQTGPGAAGAGKLRRSRKYAFEVGKDRHFEMIAAPIEIPEAGACVAMLVWESTGGQRMQQKIDAIDAAGRELARLESEAIARLGPGERLKLLQDKIIRYTKDLMNFDHFAIRAVDHRTNKLELVIAEGLPAEATEIELYVDPEANGISGYVAATGRSYICHDVEKDPRYVIGLEHCKSSLTVPLLLHDQVIGIFNVESEQVGAFDEDDRQFAEIFGRYVAIALNILNLLIVERYTTSGQMADSVVQEMSPSLNDIVAEVDKLRGQEEAGESWRAGLDRIVSNVRDIRESVRDVAAGPKTVLGSGEVEERGDPLLNRKRVLVADDEPNIRQTIADVLAKQGCECVAAADGFEASTLLERQAFDLVLSDIKMPYRNGYEIFAVAQRAREGMPVILMTGFGYDPNHSIVRAGQEGLSSVLFKPFKVDQLLEEVRKALGDPAASGAESKA